MYNFNHNFQVMEESKGYEDQISKANIHMLHNAILSPSNNNTSSFLDQHPNTNYSFNHDKASSFGSYTQYNPKLEERGTNIRPKEIGNSRFPHTSPSNSCKAEAGLSYYYLPKNPFSRKKTLVLDLDETLVHSTFKKQFFNPDFTITVEFNNQYYPIFVSTRPYLSEFLEKMSKLYEIVIFTSSIKQYANLVIDKIDPKKLISYRLYRDHCTAREDGLYTKELKRLGRDMKDVIILDNFPISFEPNKDNGLPIKSWYYDKTDKELLQIERLLEFLSHEFDVRNVISKVVTRHDIIDNLLVDMFINKNRRNAQTVRNLTYQLNNDIKEDKEVKCSCINSVYLNASFLKPEKENDNKNTRSTVVANKNMTRINDMLTQIKTNQKMTIDSNSTTPIRLKETHTPKKSMSPNRPISPNKNTSPLRQNSSIYYRKIGFKACTCPNISLEKITQLKEEINKPNKYFTAVKKYF